VGARFTQDSFTNLAPKKLNWDLKREVADRLEQLRKRTQKAINELVVEKMKELEDEDDDDDDDDDDDHSDADADADAADAGNAEEIDLD
jgi:hypothetical protein